MFPVWNSATVSQEQQFDKEKQFSGSLLSQDGLTAGALSSDSLTWYN